LAAVALGRSLFRSAGEERMAPAHRSIAEYLAARWLAHRVDKGGLPSGRVLNLLLGRDGRTVSGLRGTYAWLALHCRTARARLIDADPLTVVVYGDVKTMPVADKRNIAMRLQHEATAALMQLDEGVSQRLGDLADSALEDLFLEVLRSSQRDEDSQALVVLVVDILLYGEPVPSMAQPLLEVARDDSRWPRIRLHALRAWLDLVDDPEQKLALVEDIARDQVTDRDDELLGILLRSLYPRHLAPDALLRYLHIPKDSHLAGMYLLFWLYELPAIAPAEHVPALLDALARHPPYRARDPFEERMNAMVDKLLVRGVTLFGEQISDERLFEWLGIGADEYGNVGRSKDQADVLAQWFEQHPERYKGLLALCYDRCRGHKEALYAVHCLSMRFALAPIPIDLGRWHLDRAGIEQDEVLARGHLTEAADLLVRPRGGTHLSIEDLFHWGDLHPDRKRWLDPLLCHEIPDWRREQTDRASKREEKRKKDRARRTAFVTRLLAKIELGSAAPHVLHELAGVWMKRYSDIDGDTIEARFASYTDNGPQVHAAARAGFEHCLERTDLPSVQEIVDLSMQSKEHFIRLPCLLGIQLRWDRDASCLGVLSEGLLQRLIAFQITSSDSGGPPAWFADLRKKSPALMADVFAAYAVAALHSETDFVHGIHSLHHDAEFSEVASLSVARILTQFPTRARPAQLTHLENLLKAALRYAPQALVAIVDERLNMEDMDIAQSVYWRAAAMLLNPVKYQEQLWAYVGDSETRITALSTFLSERHTGFTSGMQLSAESVGRLIEALTPHAEVEWPRGGSGAVTPAMHRGDQVRALIATLGGIPTDDAHREIERLLTIPSLAKLKWHLERARYEQRQRQRENEFHHPSSVKVAEVFANRAPVSARDLASLVIDQLDQIAIDIRGENDDRYRPFWTEGTPNIPKHENPCRDSLLTLLKTKLDPLGIDCAAEGDYVSDKRADISVSYRSTFRLPIEIKRDSHPDLWTAMREQLAKQYTIDPRSGGYGLYVVLWFGEGGLPATIDGGKKPASAAELNARLEALLAPDIRQRIFVRVIDVSWPPKRAALRAKPRQQLN
jgi:hypothetical protein